MEERLDVLKPGKRGIVKRVSSGGALKKRLLDMGIVPGCSLEILRTAPLGDPVEVRIRGYNLSLRKEEAVRVYVEVL